MRTRVTPNTVTFYAVLLTSLALSMCLLLLQIPCTSTSVGCAPVASPDNNFAEIIYPVPEYVSPTNGVFCPDHKETLSPVSFGENVGPY